MLKILQQATEQATEGQFGTQYVDVEEITLDAKIQARTGINWLVVNEYAAAMRAIDLAELEGEPVPPDFPAVDLRWDASKETYWIADGNHRVLAAGQAGRARILANVVDGSRREALAAALGANGNHGLRRTEADKRRSVEIALKDQTWGKWSNRQIAKLCGVDHKTVGKYRLLLEKAKAIQATTERVGADGRTIDTDKIGSNQAPAPVTMATLGQLEEAIKSWLDDRLWKGHELASQTLRDMSNDWPGHGEAPSLAETLPNPYHPLDVRQALNMVASDMDQAARLARPLDVEEAATVIYDVVTRVAGRPNVLVNAETRLDNTPWERYKHAAARELPDAVIRQALPKVRRRIQEASRPRASFTPRPAGDEAMQERYQANDAQYAGQVATQAQEMAQAQADPRHRLRLVVDAALGLVDDGDLLEEYARLGTPSPQAWQWLVDAALLVRSELATTGTDETDEETA